MRSVTHGTGFSAPELRFLVERVMLTISHVNHAITLFM